jgi:hypothetical protein
MAEESGTHIGFSELGVEASRQVVSLGASQ